MPPNSLKRWRFSDWRPTSRMSYVPPGYSTTNWTEVSGLDLARQCVSRHHFTGHTVIHPRSRETACFWNFSFPFRSLHRSSFGECKSDDEMPIKPGDWLVLLIMKLTGVPGQFGSLSCASKHCFYVTMGVFCVFLSRALLFDLDVSFMHRCSRFFFFSVEKKKIYFFTHVLEPPVFETSVLLLRFLHRSSFDGHYSSNSTRIKPGDWLLVFILKLTGVPGQFGSLSCASEYCFYVTIGISDESFFHIFVWWSSF